ncbi:MAG: DUF177 domain-containing protein [Gammaproteobacteria bacterium]|nr:DUF177 domain-containing protein [Gammaproteobacteria bacterium]
MRPLEVERLAETQADIDFAGALAELAGLRARPGGVSGSVRGRARFSREQGFAVVELTVQGSATLECQRCLQRMELPVDTTTRIALVATESVAARVPDELEPVLTSAGRISMGGLVTEELLLALPIVPLHPGEVSCGKEPVPAAPADGSETHRPFADLAALLKR